MRFLRPLRPTLIDRYVAREVLPPTAVGLVLFTFVILLKEIPGLLETLISRSADAVTTLKVLGHLMPSILTLTLPMAFLLGVLFALGRMSADSEIIALRASGTSAARLLRPILALSLLATATTFYIYSVLTPASNQAHRQLLYSLLLTSARQTMKPRVFNEDLLVSRTLVIYASDIAPDTGLWKDVFISDRRNAAKTRIFLARRGRLEVDEPRRIVALVLDDGSISNYTADQQRYEVSRFASARLPLAPEEIFPNATIAKGERELTIGELSARIAELKAQGRTPLERARVEVEWHKRFSIPLACLVFGLLGLGLSLGPRREGRSAAFGVSVVVIFVYYVLLQVGHQIGNQRLVAPALAVWAANAITGTVAVVLLAMNQRLAAFDPLDFSRYRPLLPRIRRVPRPPVPRPDARPRLVIRIPRLAWRFPGVLDRYVARSFVRNLFLVLTSFCAVYVVAELMDLIDDIHQNRVRGIVVLRYYLYHSVWIFHLLVPMAVLVTVLVTFGVLARRNEITAMKAAGVSLYRAVLPSVALAVLGSLLLGAVAEFLLPAANRRALFEWNVIKGRPRQASTFIDRHWMTGADGRFYNYDYLTETGGVTFYGLSVYEVDPRNWALRDHLYAAAARWDGLAYQAERGFRAVLVPVQRVYAFDSIRTREIEPPSFFKRESPSPDTLRYGQLQEYIASIESLGLDSTKLQVQLHRKAAFPFVVLVMTLLGVPFAFSVAKRGALYGVFFSIVVAIVYYACLGTFEALGNNAWLPPPLAAWAPNILFAATGVYLLFGMET